MLTSARGWTKEWHREPALTGIVRIDNAVGRAFENTVGEGFESYPRHLQQFGLSERGWDASDRRAAELKSTVGGLTQKGDEIDIFVGTGANRCWLSIIRDRGNE